MRLCLAEGTVRDIESYYHVFHYVFYVMPVFYKCHIQNAGCTLDSRWHRVDNTVDNSIKMVKIRYQTGVVRTVALDYCWL